MDGLMKIGLCFLIGDTTVKMFAHGGSIVWLAKEGEKASSGVATN
jgi:hypothetical protein